MRQLVPALDKPSFPRKRESTAPDAPPIDRETKWTRRDGGGAGSARRLV